MTASKLFKASLETLEYGRESRTHQVNSCRLAAPDMTEASRGSILKDNGTPVPAKVKFSCI